MKDKTQCTQPEINSFIPIKGNSIACGCFSPAEIPLWVGYNGREATEDQLYGENVWNQKQ